MNRGFLILSLFTSALLYGQEPDRVTVPFSDPSRPHTLKAHLLNGGITVKGYDGKDAIIEARPRGPERERHGRRREPENTQGLKRIDNKNTGLTVEEQDNVISVGTGPMGNTIDLVIQVPVNTSLKLNTLNSGAIVVENINGEIEVNDLNGPVTITNASGSVIAHSLNSKVTAVLNKVTPDKAMSFTSMNGNIDVTLPPDVKAKVKMKTDNGEIYSDFDIRMEANVKPVIEDARSRGGKYRVKIEHAMTGTINGGGPEIQFQTFNGNIYIRKAK